MTVHRYFQLLGIAFIAITLTSYEILGGSAFPDYQNYITLAENNGWLFNENEYFFEWISRGILIYLPGFGFNPKSSVDMLAKANQIICSFIFINLILSKDKIKSIGATLLFSLIGFLFLTTTIRAAPAYLAFTLLVSRNLKLDISSILLILFGLAWHDSFIVPVCGIVAAHIISKSTKLTRLRNRISIDKSIHLLSAAALFFASQLREIALSAIGFDPGIRAVYLDGDGAQSEIKLLYCAMAILICANTYNDKSIFIINRTLATILSVGVVVSYIISGTAAVRFSMFIFCAFIPLRGVYAFKFEKIPSFRVFEFFAAISLLFLGALDTLSKTQ